MLTERIQLPTGEYSILHYQDEEGNPVDRAQAVAFESYDYDKRGRQIGRSYGEIDPQQ